MDFSLKERTALIYGPFNSTVQSLIMGLTQLGADCVLLNTDNAPSIRFCNQINDAREINLKFGRALSIKNPLLTEADTREAVNTAAHSFGSVDLFIDAQLINRPNGFKIGEEISYLDEEIHQNFKVSVLLTHAVLNYLKTRKRGRVLFLMNENYPDPILAGARSGLIAFAQNLARQMSEFNVTLNVLSLGLTEEWVMAQYPQMKTIKDAVESLKQKDSSLKITEPEKIMNTVAFLLSQGGVSLTGQVLKLT